jgi:hypothetical protein
MALKRALGCLLTLAIATGMTFAQSPSLKVAHTTHTGPIKAMKKSPAGTVTLFSNLSTPTAAYNDTTGYYVLALNNSVGLPEQAIGVPFIAPANAHVTLLQVAVQWISGTNLVKVGLYHDSNGTVGSAMATGYVANVPAFGTCCEIANVTIASTAITAGNQYWIVATPDDTNAADFTGVFDASNLANIAGDVGGSGWFSFTTNTPAAAAKGTIP